MADSSQVAYDDNFDLPRWHNQDSHASRSLQYYPHDPVPPPPPAAASSARHGRLAHLIDGDHSASLSRSTSLISRSRHHPEDLERAQPMSFYPPAVAYHQPPAQVDTYPRDLSQNEYISSPRRTTHADPNSSARQVRKQTTSGSTSTRNSATYTSGPTVYSADSYPAQAQPASPSAFYTPGQPSTSQYVSNTHENSGYNTHLGPSYQTGNPGVTRGPISSPGTPHSFTASPMQQQQQHNYFTSQDHQMAVEPVPQQIAPPQKLTGLKRVRDSRDLRPYVNPQPRGRTLDSSGIYLSPLRALTTHITQTYNTCNPQFHYEVVNNPRRVLTKPSKPAHNDGYDNDDYDYILYVNDLLGTEEGHKYLILDVLGQGTFGQVVKCQNIKTHEIVAVKVVKNKPAYFNQSMMEVTILELLNRQCDPHDEHHILRLRDSFIHRNHLCLVFELLSSNLYELIKQNSFGGLSTQLVKVFMTQLLDALTVLKEARLIHCDLKPENILLKSLQSPQIKIIDFGSACHERQTVYTYIQSRFYRSPEVLLGIPYTAAIDMWSLGCIAVELFLGLPLFPGTSEYNQITRIVEMLGMPPTHMLDMGKQTSQFFDSFTDQYGQKSYRLKSIEQYSREHNSQEQPGKKYFSHSTLPEIIRAAPMPATRSKPHELEKEINNRTAFIDFCQGLLNLNPMERWTPQQAKLHPFISGTGFMGPHNPSGSTPRSTAGLSSSGPATSDPKRPYGGLVPMQPKGTRAYQDAATYNQHLAQHQAFTAQAQVASQASNTFRNPYITPNTSGNVYSSTRDEAPVADYNSQQQSQYAAGANQQGSGHRLQHQTSAGNLSLNTHLSHYPNSVASAGGAVQVQSNNSLNPPSNSYYPRGRSNTINHDIVPPALARIANMGMEVPGIGRNALTPVMKREDAMQEWERRQTGQTTHATYPQLELLQQQAELLPPGWTQAPNQTRYAQPYHESGHDRSGVREAVMSSVRTAAANAGPAVAAVSSPPQAYAGSSSTAARYGPTYQQAPYDAYDQRGAATGADMGAMYVPLQPQYQTNYGGASSPGSQQVRVNQPPQAVPSFYGAGVVSAGQMTNSSQRNPFGTTGHSAPMNPNPQQGSSSSKEARRNSGMDLWPR